MAWITWGALIDREEVRANREFKDYKIDAVKEFQPQRRFGNAAFFRIQNYTVKKFVK